MTQIKRLHDISFDRSQAKFELKREVETWQVVLFDFVTFDHHQPLTSPERLSAVWPGNCHADLTKRMHVNSEQVKRARTSQSSCRQPWHQARAGFHVDQMALTCMFDYTSLHCSSVFTSEELLSWIWEIYPAIHHLLLDNKLPWAILSQFRKLFEAWEQEGRFFLRRECPTG